MTLEQGRRFLAALEQSANVSVACHHAGVARRDAYRYRNESPAFEKLWRRASDLGIERLEKAIRDRIG